MKIIVPTDFSECADNALRAASEIARKCNSEIHLVHVYEKPVWGFAEANVDLIKNRQMHDNIRSELQKTAYGPIVKNISVKNHIFSDIEIWKALKSRVFSDADLIVMGSHGMKGFSDKLIGTTTDKVVRHSDVPVLIIKTPREKYEFKNIVFASDFSKEIENGFGKIENFASLFSAKIHLLKVITPKTFEPGFLSINDMKEFTHKFYRNEFTLNVYNDFVIEEGILNFSREIKADLIAMETHGRTGLAHLINGSVTENLANHAPLPVLSIKIQKNIFESKTLKKEKKILQ